jgi:MinD superfamily P-loop ATPase
MREITILSGKGGTGKTSITAALAAYAQNTVFCDNDVDAADLHLILQPDIVETNTFFGGWKATIDTAKCTKCGLCMHHCRFEAIHFDSFKRMVINPLQCEGCRLCEKICPVQAIASKRNDNNFWYVSNSRFGTLVHAKMAPGEENSGKLVSQVRKRAKEIAKEQNMDYVLNDGPPGIGCAAISSVSGTNLVLMVTEPSKSGIHDVKRLAALVQSFKIPAYALINKFDINVEMATEIENYLEGIGIRVLAKIPFCKEVVEAMVVHQSIPEYNPGSSIAGQVKAVWHELVNGIK